MPDQVRRVLTDTVETLKRHFANQPRVYVSGNIPVFFSKDGREDQVIPDVFVVQDAPRRLGRSYRVSSDHKPPDMIIELISRSSVSEDTEYKFSLYQDTLRVPEYFLFDPLGDYLTPQLQGRRLSRSRYRPIAPVDGRLPSKALGLHLEGRGRDLRLYDPTTGRWLPTPDEARQAAEGRAAHAEAEVERLRRELDELRGRRNGK